MPDVKEETVLAHAMLRDYGRAKIDTFPTDLHIYTDGSAADDQNAEFKTGWGITVLAYHAPSNEFTFVGYTGGGLPPEVAEDALDAELVASCYALAWAQGFCRETSHDPKPRLWVHTDNMANKRVADGCSRLDDAKSLAKVLQHMLLKTNGPTQVCFQHVKAHRGQPWNECSDIAANLGCKGGHFPPHSHHIQHFLDDKQLELRELQCLAELMPEVYPHVDAQQDNIVEKPCWTLPSEEIAEPLQRVVKYQKKSGRKATVQLKITSASVTTILQTARAKQLAAEFLQANCHIVGLQETRTAGPGCRDNQHFLVRTSGRQETRGVPYGVELWVRRCITDEDGKDHYIKPEALCVRFCAPRYMMVSMTSSIVTAELLVAHAPCQQRPAEELESFWEELERLVTRHRRGGVPVIMMADCNVTLGRDEPHVGELAADASEETAANRFLKDAGLRVPHSFTAHNEDGEMRSTSYNANLDDSLIDYIALPLEWQHLEVATKTDFDIDISHGAVGHIAVSATVGVPPKQEEGIRSRRGLPFDTRSAFRPEAKETLAQILKEAPDIPWTTEPTAHYHQMSEWLLQRLTEEFPKGEQKAAPIWMSDDAATLLSEKKRLFKLIVLEKRLGRPPTRQLREQHAETNKKLKRQVRNDRRKAVEEILNDVTDAYEMKDVRAAFAAIKNLRPYKKRPAVMLRRGQITVATVEQEAEVWLDHWGNRLQGEKLTARQLVQEVHKRYEENGQQEATNMLELLPHRHHIAHSLMQTKANKTHGDDLVPIRVWQADPAQASRLLHPLALKQLVTREAPLHWQGGCQVPIPKAKLGPMTTPEVARGITLGSHAEKAVSRLLRRQIAQKVKEDVAPTVCGGIAGRATDYGLHIRQQYCELVRRRKMAGAILFLDLSAAFERVRRADIEDAVQQDNLREAAMMMHSEQTWLSVPHSDQLMRLKGGVRPGNPVADICFVATVAKLVEKMRRRMEMAGRTITILYNPETCPLNLEAEEDLLLGDTRASVQLCEVSYIDDVQFYVMDKSPERLVEALQCMVLDAHDIFTEAGHALNYSRGKTEILMHLQGEGARQVKMRLSQQGGMLHCDREGLQLRIRVVEQYNNLGNVQAFKAKTNRLAAAAAKAFREAYSTVPRGLLKHKGLQAGGHDGLEGTIWGRDMA
eukprot:TRINITY_DN22536_c0_g1_i5.p1 TRINITY_DN22536_c0_g1~~TRINITY_DN22536_c0_g1_i5.p1  ORF type:complete len:1158 (-),score=300.02 TRINITY_DN22536_c0_g1_i5:1082-4555(-)